MAKMKWLLFPSWGHAVSWFSLAGILSGCVDSDQILAIDSSGSAGGSGGTSSGSGGESLGGETGQPVLGPTGESVVVDGGDEHTCAIVDGRLYCWGGNQSGALGLGDVDARSMPTRLGEASDWSHVGCGNRFSCGARAGALFCWGVGTSGQLGNGNFGTLLSPSPVTLPAPVQHLAVGSEHACAVVSDGRLYCWGNNVEGQLGQDDPFPAPGVNSALPLQVGDGTSWASVSAGQGHTCAIDQGGTLFCWGRNVLGELGLGDGSSGQLRVPQAVPSTSDWAQVSAGQNHTCGIDGSGQLFCWGDNSQDQLGLSGVDVAFEPIPLARFSETASVSVDTFHGCALKVDETLSCWGRNVEGQLGDGTLATSIEGALALPRDGWDSVSVARFHTCGVREGAIFCSGENYDGRLGMGDTVRRNEFTATMFSP